MTSYQNVSESQIEGYNDCPVLDYTKKNASSSSLASRNRRRAVLTHPTSATSLTDLSINALPKPSLGPRRSDFARVPSFTAQEATAKVVSSEELLDKLQGLLDLGSGLPTVEFDHYSKRLRDIVSKDTFKNEYRNLILKCLNDFNDGQGKDNVRDFLVKFMLSNDGTSVWCQPLKKILENVKI